MNVLALEKNRSFLVKQIGKDITWSSLIEMSIIKFSQDKDAVCVLSHPESNTKYQWFEVDDFNSKFKFFDWV